MTAPFDLSGARIAAVAYTEAASDGRVRRYIEAAADAGAEVLVLSLAEAAAIPHPNVETVHLAPKYRGDSARDYLSSYATFFRAARRELGRRHVDLVHAHNMPDFLVGSAFPRVPVLLDVHDIMSDVYAEKSLQLPRPARAILNASLLVEQFASWNLASAIQTVHHPYARRIRSLGAIRPDIVVGLNVPDPTVFRAAPYLPGAHCRFVMAGSIVAPRARVQTAWVLTGLSLILGVVGMIVVWSGIEVGWIQVTVRPPSTGWGMAMATASGLAGLLLAVHFVRKGEERRVARSAL